MDSPPKSHQNHEFLWKAEQDAQKAAVSLGCDFLERLQLAPDQVPSSFEKQGTIVDDEPAQIGAFGLIFFWVYNQDFIGPPIGVI